MDTVEMTEPVNVTVATLSALVARVQTTREALVATWTTAAATFRDAAPSPTAEVERARAAWRGYAPGLEPRQLFKETQRLVAAERALREALGEARGVLAEGAAAMEAARISSKQIRAAATAPRELAEADELERAARDLAIASAAMEDETITPAGRLAALAAKGLPLAVAAALTVLRGERAARAGFQLGELRWRAESIRSIWPGEPELEALAVEVEARTGQPLPVPALDWPSDLLMPPRLAEPRG